MKNLTVPPHARKMRTIAFYLREEFLGEGSCGVQNIYGSSRLEFPASAVFVCPKCGEAWGVARVDGISYFPVPRHCPDHGGGSLLLAGAKISYPPEVIRRALIPAKPPFYWSLFPISNGVYDEYFSFR